MSAIPLLGGCIIADAPIGARSEDVNRTIADYRNVSTLLNIARASNADPLNFVSITGFTGHGTSSLSLGLPSITIGPIPDGGARNYVFGPNSTGLNFSNDFTNGVIDDQASTIALMTPLTPGSVGFLSRFGQDLLIRTLFISEIRIYDPATDKTYEFDEDFATSSFPFAYCESSNCKESKPVKITDNDIGFYKNHINLCRINSSTSFCYSPMFMLLNILQDAGLAFQIGRNLELNNINNSSFRLCFDKVNKTKNRDELLFDLSVRDMLAYHTHEGDGRTNIGSSSTIGAVCDSSNTGWIDPPKKDKQGNSSPDHKTNYEVVDPQSKMIISFTFRSALDVYNFLGSLIDDDHPPFHMGEDFKNEMLIDVRHNGSYDCFAQATYNRINYCVPNQARLTKKVFAILHNLINILTKPTNGDQTKTVRSIPQ